MKLFNGLGMHLGNLPRLSNAKTRSISPENFTGEKGGGAKGYTLCRMPGWGLLCMRLGRIRSSFFISSMCKPWQCF